MTYQFARVDLKKNTDAIACDWYYIANPDSATILALRDIYRTYCSYKHFVSVMPMFDSQFTDANTDVIGYSHNSELVAFSLITRYNATNALCAQFAWNYRNPRLRLGIRSLQTECAIYRERGFEYLYLDQAHLYKQGIAGFELLGPLE
jgi:hypothetical protein